MIYELAKNLKKLHPAGPYINLFPNPAGHPVWGSKPAGPYLNPIYLTLLSKSNFINLTMRDINVTCIDIVFLSNLYVAPAGSYPNLFPKPASKLGG